MWCMGEWRDIKGGSLAFEVPLDDQLEDVEHGVVVVGVDTDGVEVPQEPGSQIGSASACRG